MAHQTGGADRLWLARLAPAIESLGWSRGLQSRGCTEVRSPVAGATGWNGVTYAPPSSTGSLQPGLVPNRTQTARMSLAWPPTQLSSTTQKAKLLG